MKTKYVRGIVCAATAMIYTEDGDTYPYPVSIDSGERRGLFAWEDDELKPVVTIPTMSPYLLLYQVVEAYFLDTFSGSWMGAYRLLASEAKAPDADAQAVADYKAAVALGRGQAFDIRKLSTLRNLVDQIIDALCKNRHNLLRSFLGRIQCSQAFEGPFWILSNVQEIEVSEDCCRNYLVPVMLQNRDEHITSIATICRIRSGPLNYSVAKRLSSDGNRLTIVLRKK